MPQIYLLFIHSTFAGGNYSLSSSWTYKRGNSPGATHSMSPKQTSYRNMKLYSENYKTDPITDENSLDEFLREQEMFEKINRVQSQSSQSSNLLSSFWRHPITKNPKDSLVLSKCKYQLSPLSRGKILSKKFYSLDIKKRCS